MKVARERKSSVLASNAVHHRVDSLTGVVALLAVLGANLVQGATWLDPVGGLFISLLVIRAGLANTVSALYELADRSIDDEVRASVSRRVGEALQEQEQEQGQGQGQTRAQEGGFAELRDVTGVKSGQNYLVDVELAVPGRWTVEQARAVEEAVRARVGAKVRGVRRVRVRFVPKEVQVEEKEKEAREKETEASAAASPRRRFDEFIPPDVSPRASPEPEDCDDSGHRKSE